MKSTDLAFTEIYYAANIAVLLTGLVISALATKFMKNKTIKGLIIGVSLLIFSCSFIGYSRRQSSKYQTFDVQRCANKRDIVSRFRLWSKTVHPDSQNESETNSLSYEELDTIKDFLSDTNKRLFYDKFNVIFERDNIEEKDYKEIYNYLFQDKLFESLNFTFLCIFLTFLISKYLARLELANFILKILIAKSFIMIYYLYSQKVDSCSFLDDIFAHLTISQQIYYSEFWFSFAFGLAIGLYNDYLGKSKIAALDKIQFALKKLESKKDKAEIDQKLVESVQNYYKYVNN
jgi:hypothetical protein